MKKPLNYQVTEYDCGKASLENAFSYLFEREEIPAEIIKLISTYTLDCYDEHGNPGSGGTSTTAMKLLSNRLNDYAKAKKVAIFSKHIVNKDVNTDLIYTTLKYNGIIILRTMLGCEHYVLITKIDNEYIYIWDPYYLENEQKNIEIILEQPFTYNRKIVKEYFERETDENYVIGREEKRECMIIHRKY